jgi:hypothetical protein
MKHLIKNPRDFWAGVFFIVVGGMFGGVATTYKIGTAARMGPGYFPMVLGGLLALLGLIILLTALSPKNVGPKVERFYWGPNFWVLGSIVLFGLTLKLFGALLSGVLLIVLSGLGSHEFKLRDTLLLGVALTAFCAAVFVWGLGLPIPLCPSAELFQQFKLCRV